MTRRGKDAKARARRHRAAVSIRSQTAGRASVTAPQSPAPTQTTNKAPSRHRSAPSRRMRTRKPPPAATLDAVDKLRELVAQREEVIVAIDREVNRLRRLGARWPDIAQALGVSRQAARQKYKVRGGP